MNTKMEKTAFRDILGDFYNKPDKKSITLEELESFWLFSKSYKLDCIVESGTYRGLTAKRLSLLYPHCIIYSFEKRHERFRNIPKKNYADNIKYVYGFLDRKLLDSNTAVMIDGPKRTSAIKLAYKCRKTVPFVAIHDMVEYRYKLEKKFRSVMFTGQLAICV